MGRRGLHLHHGEVALSPEVLAAFRRITPARAARQHGYWQGLCPVTHEDRLRRWLFAFCSVHTTWEGNVRGYNAIKGLEWRDHRVALWKRLRESGVGLHNTRTRYIWAFQQRFHSSPTDYEKQSDETWPAYRNRLSTQIPGLGYAKTSFAIELLYPTSAEVVCLDVHMLRLYGHAHMNGRSGSRFGALYQQLEADWIARCQAVGAPSYIARCVFWDAKQKKRDSRYWSHCLETL